MLAVAIVKQRLDKTHCLFDRAADRAQAGKYFYWHYFGLRHPCLGNWRAYGGGDDVAGCVDIDIAGLKRPRASARLGSGFVIRQSRMGVQSPALARHRAGRVMPLWSVIGGSFSMTR